MKKFTKGIAVLLLAAAMATSAAAYTDEADISDSHVEAVDVLTAMNVATGSEGTYRLDDTFTRAEAAKLIYSSRLDQQKVEATVAEPAPAEDNSITKEETAALVKELSNAGKYVEASIKLAMLDWTSALPSDNIILEALMDDDAETVVTLTEAGEIRLAYGEKVKAKEFVIGVQDGSAAFTLSQSNDGQTWEKSVSKTVVDKSKGIVRLVNQSGAKAMFYKIGIEPGEEITLDSLVSTKDATGKTGAILFKSIASNSVDVTPYPGVSVEDIEPDGE